MNVQKLKDKLLDLSEEVQQIQAKADSENRDLSADEDRQINELYDQFERTETELKALEYGIGSGRKAEPQQPAATSRLGNDSRPKPQKAKSRFINLQTGEPIKAYSRRENISPLSEQGDFVVGEAVRAMVLNDLGMLPSNIRNAVTSGSDVDGGYLTSATLSSRFVDLARENAVCVRAGAQSVQLPSGEVRIGKLDTDPTHYWRQETAAVTASKPAFGQIVMRPKVVACLIPISMEAAEDMANGVQLIEQTVGNVLGVALDQAALTGSGAAAEPLGLTNNSSVNARAGIGTPTTYANVSSSIGDILAANYTGAVSDLSWVLPPAVATVYDQLVTGITNDHTPLQPTEWVKQLQRFHTTSLSASTDSPQQYSMIVGQFEEMLFGFRVGGMRMQLLDAGQVTDSDGDTWNAVSQMMVFLRAFIRVDVACLRPTWFTHLSGVTL